MTNRISTLETIKLYPYIVDISGIVSYKNECDIWLYSKFGDPGDGRWEFFFNFLREPIFDKYADCGGIDFAMFSNKNDMVEFMLVWK